MKGIKNTKYMKCGKKMINSNGLQKNEETFCNEYLLNGLDYGKWSLSKEKVVIENLFVGRFDFFLIIFSLFVTAGFANTLQNFRYLVFYFGAFLLILCWITLLRMKKKLDLILNLLFNKEGHTIFILQKILKNGGYKSRLVISRWMGIYIPLICIFFLLAIGLFINLGVMK